MKKHPLLYYITPCILASVLALLFTILGLADSQSGGFGIILVFFLVPALCICIGLDWLVKKITKGNLLYIWIIEIILIGIGLMCFPSLRISGC